MVRGDGGADRPVPTATQVMNALRAESALDEKMGAEEQKPAGIAACGNSSAQSKEKKQDQGKGKRKKGARGKKQKYDKQLGKKSGKQKTRTCFHCGKVGHLRSNCPNRDEDSSDDQEMGSQTAISERKRWQSKSKDGNNNKRKKISAVG